GVRCAEYTPTSEGTSNSPNAVTAGSSTGQSESLPMITPTLDSSLITTPLVLFLADGTGTRCPHCPHGPLSQPPSMNVVPVGPFGVRQPVRGVPRTHPQRFRFRTEQVHMAQFPSGTFGLAVEVHLDIGESGEEVVQSFVDAHFGLLFGAEHVRHHTCGREHVAHAEWVVEHCPQVLFEL